MTPSDLIGAAGAASIRLRLNSLSDADGVARYLLDRLTGEQVAAITSALLQDAGTEVLLKIALPRTLIGDFGLPEHVVTDERTVAVRHADCDRPALLLANTDDDQGASLGDVTLIGAKQLTEDADPWVEAAALGLGLPDSQIGAWKAALKGLNAADDWTLHQISNYVALARERIATESTTVPDALGWALPALHLPRDSGFFLSIREKEFDLYAPGLEQVGLGPDRILYAQGTKDAQVLAMAEDGLRDGSLACVIAEVKAADMTATRRLQLAASDGQTPVLLYRRHRTRERCPLGTLSAAMTRWRIGCAESARLPHAGVGRPRWSVELVRQRAGNPFILELEACDEQGRLALPAAIADRATARGRAVAQAA